MPEPRFVTTRSPIVVFDGMCKLCSGAVRFILRNDVDGRIWFAPMQSALGRDLMTRHGIDPGQARTFLLVKDGTPYLRSDAALEVARLLPRWRWLRVIRWVPRRLRDGVYDWIARNRYRWFGKREACFVPTPERRARFLDLPEA